MTVAGIMKTHPRFKQSGCNRKYKFNPFIGISALKGVGRYLFSIFIQILMEYSMRRSRWEGTGDPPPPLENHKAIGFLSNTGPHPLENHKESNLKFNVGPLSAPTACF